MFYGNIRAVDGRRLRVDAGETVALIGSNGAGKSTTAADHLGPDAAASGTIRYEGPEITRASTDRIVGAGHLANARRAGACSGA